MEAEEPAAPVTTTDIRPLQRQGTDFDEASAGTWWKGHEQRYRLAVYDCKQFDPTDMEGLSSQGGEMN